MTFSTYRKIGNDVDKNNNNSDDYVDVDDKYTNEYGDDSDDELQK